MQTMLVIGLGRFGRHLALKLIELGNEVMVIDKDEEAVKRIASQVTSAQIGDCMDPDVITSLGARNFDVCFVCISDNFQSSLEVTWLLKKAGARLVVSKTERETHSKFLEIIGADAVIHPERDMAIRTAMKYTSKNIFDYIEFTENYAIIELGVPHHWVGMSIKSLRVREKYNVNIIATKSNGQYYPVLDTNHVFVEDEHMFVAGSKRDIMKLVDK